MSFVPSATDAMLDELGKAWPAALRCAVLTAAWQFGGSLRELRLAGARISDQGLIKVLARACAAGVTVGRTCRGCRT